MLQVILLNKLPLIFFCYKNKNNKLSQFTRQEHKMAMWNPGFPGIRQYIYTYIYTRGINKTLLIYNQIETSYSIATNQPINENTRYFFLNILVTLIPFLFLFLSNTANLNNKWKKQM